MFPIEVDLLARKERSRDFHREAALEQLIHEADLDGSGYWVIPQKVAGWLGSQVMKWSSKR